VSAAARDPNDDPLRPTREVPLRPTREPNAPFVPGPATPRVAPAPRVIGPRGSLPTPQHRRQLDEREISRAPALMPIDRFLVAAFDQRRIAAGVVALRERGWTVTPLRRAAPGAGGLSRELARALHRATLAATSIGALGALIGALIVPSEALIPTLGWIPGPAVGAALLAGVLGAMGFALGLLAILVTPSRALNPMIEGSEALLAVHAPESTDAIAAAVVAAGGSVVAH